MSHEEINALHRRLESLLDQLTQISDANEKLLMVDEVNALINLLFYPQRRGWLKN